MKFWNCKWKLWKTLHNDLKKKIMKFLMLLEKFYLKTWTKILMKSKWVANMEKIEIKTRLYSLLVFFGGNSLCPNSVTDCESIYPRIENLQKIWPVI